MQVCGWYLLSEMRCPNFSKELSLEVGDSAGRSGDFSSSDLHFALGAVVRFTTDEYFVEGYFCGFRLKSFIS